MRTLQLQGVIISKRDFGEQDKLFNIFTEKEGKIEIIAKNIRSGTSKRSSHMELFNHGTFFLYKSPTHYYLNQCQTIDEFQKLKSNLDTISAGYFAAEILDKLTPIADPHEDLFQLMVDFLRQLGEYPQKNPILLLTFKLQLLSKLGILPHDIECSKCGSKLAPATKYIPEEHSFYCEECIDRNGVTLSPSTIKLFYFLTRKHLSESIRIKSDHQLDLSLNELTMLTDLYLQDHLGRPMRVRS